MIQTDRADRKSRPIYDSLTSLFLQSTAPRKAYAPRTATNVIPIGPKINP